MRVFQLFASGDDGISRRVRFSNNQVPIHVEAFYKYQINDNIYLNPGFYTIFNPENDSRNDTIFVGLIRTTFEF